MKSNTNFTSAKPLDNCLQTTNEENLNSSAPLLTNLNLQSNNCINRQTEDVNCENRNNQKENIHSQHHNMIKPELTLSLSDKLGSLALHTNPDEVQRPVIPCQAQQGPPKSIPPKPTCLQIPSARISLAEKRKCLTLSLTPVSGDPQAHRKVSTANTSDVNQRCSSTVDQKGEFGGLGRVNKERPAAETRTEANRSRREATARHSCSRSHKKKNELNASRAKEEQPKTNLSKPGDISSTTSQRQIQGGITTSPQEVLEREVTGGVEAVESMGGNQSPLSPVSLTVNKILDWGERMLLGVLLGPRIKMGQAALPYRC